MNAELFDQFCAAGTMKHILGIFREMCALMNLTPAALPQFYPLIKSKLSNSWRANALFKKFDARLAHKSYAKGTACSNSKVLIIGGGPSGLRAAIECQLLGAKVVVVEKRDRFSRNNVLHLWPFVIQDLRLLGAKKFFGKFCAGSIDHISIRQLQIILLKISLMLGVEFHENVGFEELLEPSVESDKEPFGWRARVSPANHPLNEYEFDTLIGADGKKNTLHGFKKNEMRGKQAIAVTANFINRHSKEEAAVQEISGLSYIYNQKFFIDLRTETGIDLENIVYYKDDTHYFVMTAKKSSLLLKGVLIEDYSDTAKLLSPENVNRAALTAFAEEAVKSATGNQMPKLDFALNHYGEPDVAIFDFTSMYAAENASMVKERFGASLLIMLVGDSLLEPFWPTGSGCGRGFLSAMDAAWTMKCRDASPMPHPVELMIERESIYRLLAQTTPDNLQRELDAYSLDPSSRYKNLNKEAVLSFRVTPFYDSDDPIPYEKGRKLDYNKKRRDITDYNLSESQLISWVERVVMKPIERTSEGLIQCLSPHILARILNYYRQDLDVDESDPMTGIAEHLDIPAISATITTAQPIMKEYLTSLYYKFKGHIPQLKYELSSTIKQQLSESRKRRNVPANQSNPESRWRTIGAKWPRSRKSTNVSHISRPDSDDTIKPSDFKSYNLEQFNQFMQNWNPIKPVIVKKCKVGKLAPRHLHKSGSKSPQPTATLLPNRTMGKLQRESADPEMKEIEKKKKPKYLNATAKNSNNCRRRLQAESISKFEHKKKIDEDFECSRKCTENIGVKGTHSSVDALSTRFEKIGTKEPVKSIPIRKAGKLGLHKNKKKSRPLSNTNLENLQTEDFNILTYNWKKDRFDAKKQQMTALAADNAGEVCGLGADDWGKSYVPKYDYGLQEYRATVPEFGERVRQLEQQLLNINLVQEVDPADKVSTRRRLNGGAVARLAAELASGTTTTSCSIMRQGKPRDLLRAVGKIDTSDWNVREINKKIDENRLGRPQPKGAEKVPKWDRQQFLDRQTKITGEASDERDETVDAFDNTIRKLDLTLRDSGRPALGSQQVAKLQEKFRNDEKRTSPARTCKAKKIICVVCGERIFGMDRIIDHDMPLHKKCFKCGVCGMQLKSGHGLDSTLVYADMSVLTAPERVDVEAVPSDRREMDEDEWTDINCLQSGTSGAGGLSDVEGSSSAYSEAASVSAEDNDDSEEETSDEEVNVGDHRAEVYLSDDSYGYDDFSDDGLMGTASCSLEREARKQRKLEVPPLPTDSTEGKTSDSSEPDSKSASATEVDTDSEFGNEENIPVHQTPSITINDAFLPPPILKVPYALTRTKSACMASSRALELKKKYLLGDSPTTNVKKSDSTSCLNGRFESFQTKITQIQQMLMSPAVITCGPVINSNTVYKDIEEVNTSTDSLTKPSKLTLCPIPAVEIHAADEETETSDSTDIESESHESDRPDDVFPLRNEDGDDSSHKKDPPEVSSIAVLHTPATKNSTNTELKEQTNTVSAASKSKHLESVRKIDPMNNASIFQLDEFSDRTGKSLTPCPTRNVQSPPSSYLSPIPFFPLSSSSPYPDSAAHISQLDNPMDYQRTDVEKKMEELSKERERDNQLIKKLILGNLDANMTRRSKRRPVPSPPSFNISCELAQYGMEDMSLKEFLDLPTPKVLPHESALGGTSGSASLIFGNQDSRRTERKPVCSLPSFNISCEPPQNGMEDTHQKEVLPYESALGSTSGSTILFQTRIKQTTLESSSSKNEEGSSITIIRQGDNVPSTRCLLPSKSDPDIATARRTSIIRTVSDFFNRRLGPRSKHSSRSSALSSDCSSPTVPPPPRPPQSNVPIKTQAKTETKEDVAEDATALLEWYDLQREAARLRGRDQAFSTAQADIARRDAKLRRKLRRELAPGEEAATVAEIMQLSAQREGLLNLQSQDQRRYNLKPRKPRQ